jgi:hypothetical protein
MFKNPKSESTDKARIDLITEEMKTYCKVILADEETFQYELYM